MKMMYLIKNKESDRQIGIRIFIYVKQIYQQEISLNAHLKSIENF